MSSSVTSESAGRDMSTTKRRKQQQPRHIVQEEPFVLTRAVENGVSFDHGSTTDNHICGKCCAEFYTMNAFMLHKRNCTLEWPVIVDDDGRPTDNVATPTDDDADNLTPTSDASRRAVSPANVAQIQTALASLQQQQHLQLQLIQQIYRQLLGEKSNGVAVPSRDVVEVDSLKCRVLSSLKDLERNVAQSIDDQRKADAFLDRIYRKKCELCGIVVDSDEQLQEHLRAAHIDELNLPYACPHCTDRFVSRDELHEHIDDQHRILDDDDEEDFSESFRPKSYPSAVSKKRLLDDDDDEACAKSDPGTYRMTSTAMAIASSSTSSPENSLYTGNNEDWTQEPRSRADSPAAISFDDANLESSPLDLTTPSLSMVKSTSLPIVSAALVNEPNRRQFDPYMIFPPFTTSTPMAVNSKSPKGNNISGDPEDDWESLMEIQNTDEAAKIRQLVGDKDTKVTDPNQCIICHRILSCKSALQMHYRTHTGTRPFKCKVCQRAFTTKGNLKTHMGVHRTKPPFRLFHQCPVCHKRFTNGLVLQQHIRLHIGQPLEISLEQIHAAEIKESADSRSNSPVAPPTMAPPAPTVFTSSGHSSVIQSPHRAPCVVLPIDNNNFITDNNKVINNISRNEQATPTSTPMTTDVNQRRAFSFSPANHSQYHSAPATEPSSPVSMQSPGPLTVGSSNPFTPVMGPTPQQMAMMTGRPSTTCNICFKTFACYSALEIHYRSHTKERPFKCDICHRGFSTKGNMKQHLLTHKIRDMPGQQGQSKSGSLGANDDSGRDSVSQSSTNGYNIVGIKSENCRSNSAYENGDSPLSAQQPTKFTSPMSSGAAMIGHQRNAFSSNDVFSPTPSDGGGPAPFNGLAGGGPTPLESIQKMWAKTETLAASTAGAADMSSGEAQLKKHPVFNKHQCQLCYKNFSSASALQIHMRTHTGDRPFSCKVCSRAFTTKGNLKVHMGTHMWTNTNRRGRRIFDVQSNSNGNFNGPNSMQSGDYSDDDDDENPSKDSSMTPSSKNIDNDDRKSTSNNAYHHRYDDSIKSPKSAPFYIPPFCSPNNNIVGFPQLPCQTSTSSASSFGPLDSLAPHLLPNPFSPSFPAGFSPYQVSPLTQMNPFAQAVNGGRSGGDGSLESMLMMWRTVCSVCHKVCATASELEDHLKHHLGQVGVDRKTPLQT